MEYMDPHWIEIFNHNQLKSFDDIWELKLPLVDEGNHGRGGHSLVSRHTLMSPNGKEEVVYIKRQENYNCFSWRHPFSGTPTFEREFINWQRFQQLGLGTYEVVYFAKRKHGKQQQAILITRELPAKDLVHCFSDPMLKAGHNARRLRQQITYSVAECLRKMHDAGLLHGHLSPKHVFIGGLPDKIQSYVIDMELMRKVPWKQQRVVNDLSRFTQRAHGSTLTDRMRFFKYYLGVSKLSSENKQLWRAIAARASTRTATAP